MTTLAITINGREYNIACEDGQERRLQALAGLLDSRVGELKESTGIFSDNMLLVLAGLMLADEVTDLRRESEAMRQGDSDAGHQESRSNVRISGIVNDIAQRIEKLASRLEKV